LKSILTFSVLNAYLDILTKNLFLRNFEISGSESRLTSCTVSRRVNSALY